MAGNTPKAQAIGAELRTARETVDLGVRAIAERLGVTPATVSRWENGHRAPRPKDVARYLAELEAPAEQIAELVDLAHGSDGSPWLSVGLPEQRRQLSALLEVERTAHTITEVSPMLIPGLLQTGEYARAIMHEGGVPTDEIDTRVAIRLGRRDALNRPSPAHLTAVICEAALHQGIGGPSVMADQLKELITLGDLPTVSLHVVPTGSGWNPILEGPFVLVECPDREVVHLENRRSGLFFHDELDVAVYKDAVDRVLQAAISSEDTKELIADVANRMETA